MQYYIGNSGGETSGMLTNQMLKQFDRNALIIGFQNTGDEDVRTLDFLHSQERYWGTKFLWHEYEFIEGFAEAILKKPATYEALEECVKEGSGFAGMYHTELLDSIRWNNEFKDKTRRPESIKKDIENGQMQMFGIDQWDYVETIADYNRMFKEFYALFGKARNELRESRFMQVDYKTADRAGIPFLKNLLYKNAVRYTKHLPYVLPNPAQRFSTGDLKVRVSDDYLAGLGLKQGVDFVKCLGIRHDEGDRYFGNLQKDGSVWMPLYEQKVTTSDVKAFWDAFPVEFQLAIRNEKWMGNCVDCYLKSKLRRIKACQSSPEHYKRRNILEKAAGDCMKRGESAELILKLAGEIVVTAEDIENDSERQLNCFC